MGIDNTPSIFDKYLRTYPLKEIIRIRDNYDLYSKEWDMLNLIKAIKLESKNKKYSEELLVIDSSNNILEEFNGENFIEYKDEINFKIENSSHVIRRGVAEFNNRYRQLIGNAVVHSKGKILVMRRKSNGPLNGLLGMPGGHINKEDGCVYVGLIRELKEELKCFSPHKAKVEPFGFIKMSSIDNDGQNSISEEHLCCLYSVEVLEPILTGKEKGESVEWYDYSQLEKMIRTRPELFDSWAKLAFEEYLLKVNASNQK